MIHLRVPASFVYRDVVLRVVVAACKVSRGLHPDSAARAATDDFQGQLISAVGEAFNNVVGHAYRGGVEGELTVIVEPGADRLVIRVLDSGASFDPTAVPEPDLDALPESGMGMYIIRKCMDTVAYHPGAPNELVLTKRFLFATPPGDPAPRSSRPVPWRGPLGGSMIRRGICR